jgi:hypothetical protein
VVEEAAPREALDAMTLWVTPEFREELAAVGALLSHAVPSGKRALEKPMSSIRQTGPAAATATGGTNAVALGRGEAYVGEADLPARRRRDA